MSAEPTLMRLGELLVNLGLLKHNELNEAVQVAVETGLPLGRVLIMSSLVTEAQLQAVIQAQSLLKDRILSLETAAEAIRLVSKTNGTLRQALKELGWVQQEVVPSNKLGEFLLSAGMINQEQLKEAMISSEETGLPLGRVLVLRGTISEELLASALTAQVFVRDEKITRDQAIQGLKAARQRQVTIEQSLAEHGFYKPRTVEKVKMGELFVIAGLLVEKDVINALELGLLREQPVGEVLVDSGLITKELLETAVRLQEMVDNNTLNILEASQVLRQIQSQGINMAQAVAELGLLKGSAHEKIKLGELLKLAGLITDDDIQEALNLSLRNAALVGKILLINGLIDERLLHAALRCQFLLREGFLNQEQAIIALNYCQKMQCSFDDAIAELGWTAPTRTAPGPLADPGIKYDTAPS